MLTDGKGRTVNFKNSILVMTSNVGSKRIMELSRLEHDAVDDADKEKEAIYNRLSEVVKEELEIEMRPEFLNRIDEIVVFSPLSATDLSSIVDLILQQTVKRAQKEHSMELVVGPFLAKKIMEEGSMNASQFGARPMRRAAQRFFEDPVSDAIVRGFLKSGESAIVEFAEDDSDAAGAYYSVQITRASDGKSLQVPVELVSGGIGSTTSSNVKANGDQDALSPESTV